MIKKPITYFDKLFNFTCPFCNEKVDYCFKDDHSYSRDRIIFQIGMYYCIVKLNNEIKIFEIYPQFEEEYLLYTGYIDSSDKNNLVNNMVNMLDNYLNNMIFI